MDNIEQIGVSVIIPTFKQKELLIIAVESVLNQTHEKLEIVLVNDNIDLEYDLFIQNYISEIKIRNIVYLKNEENIGSALSRNRGIDAASFDFITFLDDDDFFEKKKIEWQLLDMIKANADYSVCNIKLVHENGYQDIRKRNYLARNEPLLNKHLKYHITATSTFMFRKSLLLNIGGFPPSDLGDEFLMMVKAILVNDNFIHCNKVAVTARVVSDSGLSSADNKIESENRLIEFKEDYFKKLRNKDIRYIKMRHNLVKSMSYFKNKDYFSLLLSLTKVVYFSPIGSLRVIIGYDR